MFYQECERLAREKPALEKLIVKIDILLYKISIDGIIRPDEVARILDEQPSRVSGALKALSEYGLLNDATYFECSSCGNLVSPQDYEEAIEQYGHYECSQCMKMLGDSLKGHRVKVYELNPTKVIQVRLFKDVPKPLKVFYSYAHEDEGLRKELEKHLSPLRREGLIQDWHDRKLLAGSEFGTEIDGHLKESHIVLLLISSDFFSSDYCYSIEMQYALAKHHTNEMRVIPVIIRECDWSRAPFAKLLALPTDGKAVTSRAWSGTDEAFTIVAKGIRDLISSNQR